MAKDLGFPEEWEPVILHHHERYDGGGYPEGLMGDNIPLEARVLHVADVIDALRTPRPYRRSLSPYEITIELEYGEGSDFDPKVLSTLRRLDLRLLLGREVGEQSSGPSVLVPRQKTVLTASDLKAALGWTMPGRRRWFSVRPSTN